MITSEASCFENLFFLVCKGCIGEACHMTWIVTEMRMKICLRLQLNSLLTMSLLCPQEILPTLDTESSLNQAIFILTLPFNCENLWVIMDPHNLGLPEGTLRYHMAIKLWGKLLESIVTHLCPLAQSILDQCPQGCQALKEATLFTMGWLKQLGVPMGLYPHAADKQETVTFQMRPTEMCCPFDAI